MKSGRNICITMTMDDELLRLRDQSYETGMKHDQALVNCADVLIGADYAVAEHAAQQHSDVAMEYGAALARLNERLKELEPTNIIEDERRRVEKLLDLLDRETDIVKHRLAIMKKNME